MVGRDGIKVLCCAAILLGFTWERQPGDLTIKGYTGFTFDNSLQQVKGANWSDPYNFSDMRMGTSPVIGGALDYFITEWLSVRLDGWYQPKGCGNCIKQQAVAMTKIGDGPPVKRDTKGWKGDAIIVMPSLNLHAPCIELDRTCLSLYGGIGPTVTMSRLCDNFGCTDSNDLGFAARGGLSVKISERWSVFAEINHKTDYMSCADPEGCFRGRRVGEAAFFGMTWTFDRR